jgi:hypothetical protein
MGIPSIRWHRSKFRILAAGRGSETTEYLGGEEEELARKEGKESGERSRRG